MGPEGTENNCGGEGPFVMAPRVRKGEGWVAKTNFRQLSPHLAECYYAQFGISNTTIVGMQQMTLRSKMGPARKTDEAMLHPAPAPGNLKHPIESVVVSASSSSGRERWAFHTKMPDKIYCSERECQGIFLPHP